MQNSKKLVTFVILFSMIALGGCSLKNSETIYDKIDDKVWTQIKEVRYETGSGEKYTTDNKDIINKLPNILKSTKIWVSDNKQPMTGYSAIIIITQKKEPISLVFEGMYIKINNVYYLYEENINNSDNLHNFIDSIKSK